ncbi:MAG: FecR domain-containing protein [Cyanobacteria bacterium J06554_6]
MGLFSSASKRSLKHYSGLIGVLIVLGLPQAVQAQTVLTWARVEFLRNRVQLIPNGAGVRSAQIADILGIGDALRTARASRAELRFNDGSLARIGERATFRFTPNTRNFQLSNGTVLLLIPPGRGRTTIQTPNAVTGIQGSALFVRFIEETDTTIIGALTNNPAGPMVAYNEDGSQEQLLYAGQMVVIEGDQITRLFDFDIAEFYRTSGLMQDLDAEDVEGVYQEMLDALEQQQQLEGDDLQENPSFIMPPAISRIDSEDVATVPEFDTSPAARFHQAAVVAESGSSSRYQQSTTETDSPLSSLDAANRANQINAVRQQQGVEAFPNTSISEGPSSDPAGATIIANPGPGTIPDPVQSDVPVSPSSPAESPIPDASPPGGDALPSSRPGGDGGALDWVPETTTPAGAETVPTNDAFSQPEPSPEPTPQTTEAGQPEVLLNPNSGMSDSAMPGTEGAEAEGPGSQPATP